MLKTVFINRSKEIIKLAVPAVGEMILYMLIWVFDTLMVGKYGGQTAVSAVGFSSEIMYTFINILIGMGLSISITSIVARSLGGGETKKARDMGNVGLKLGIGITTLVFLVFYISSKDILILAGAKDDVLTLGYRYMRICSMGLLFNMSTNILNGIFRGCKNTKTPLYGAALLNIVNLSLDYVLIFGKFGFPELGIEGAAIATVTGNVVAFLFILNSLKKLPFKLSLKDKMEFKNMKELVKLAIPSGLQEGAFSIVRLLSVMMVMRLGSLAFSANQISVTIESISFMPGWGFAISSVSLVGYSIGKKDLKEAREYANVSLFLAVMVMGFFSLVFLFFSENLVRLFIKSDEVEVIALGAACLMIGAIQQIPTAIDMVLSGALKGMGDTKTPFRIVLFCNWCIRLPLMYYFIYLKKMPVTYFWWITSLQWTVEAAIFVKFYRDKFYKNVV
ncbi:MATE family efflux transporter [uncultured Cetobacterium sp.]|uniref:MATE family efflux transporter n=1 Tax=uncultured Cetobacterium sp. TaxID=527638 RepID=UPI0025E7C8CB|nr:MATE family efflux transporter [uncultured Cetobacterium sp.]